MAEWLQTLNFGSDVAMYFKALAGVQYELRAAEGTRSNCDARVCRYREARGEFVAASGRCMAMPPRSRYLPSSIEVEMCFLFTSWLVAG